MTYHFDPTEILGLHESGLSVQAIAQIYGSSYKPIRRILEESGAQFRTPAEQRALNVIRDPTLKERMVRRIHPINESYFNLRTPSMAYVVGFMQADGYNNVSLGQIRITLKTSDASHLTAIAEEMGADRPLFPDVLGNPTLAIYSKRLSVGLAQWGVASPKSHTASTHPDMLNDRDYWRGIVDGDGSLCEGSKGRVLELVGSDAICGQFLDFCRARGARTKSRIHRSRGIWSVALPRDDSVRIASVLYKGAILALRRKQVIADRWIAAA